MSSRRSYTSSAFHTTFAFQQGGNLSQGVNIRNLFTQVLLGLNWEDKVS
jgi:hypothetical protein